VRDAVIGWKLRHRLMSKPWSLPVVAENFDGLLNDIDGFHVKAEHACEGLTARRRGTGCDKDALAGGYRDDRLGWKGGKWHRVEAGLDRQVSGTGGSPVHSRRDVLAS